MWAKHKDSQIRINRQNQGNDNNSWLVLSSKGEKKSEKCSAFLVKLCKAKSFIILFRGTYIKPQVQTLLKNSVRGKVLSLYRSLFKIRDLYNLLYPQTLPEVEI